MKKVCIIIPAYNEEKRIWRTLKEYSSYFSELEVGEVLKYQILVVINGTVDGTEEIVKNSCDLDKHITYMNLDEGGKGNAVIKGFERALKKNFDLIGFSDADMATSPEEFFKLIKDCESFDGVIADRYHKRSKITPKLSLKKLVAKKAFNFVSRSLLVIPFRDTQCGAKIFKKKVLSQVIPSLTMSNWAFDVELLYNLHKKGFRIKSLPINWHDEGYSTLNFWKSGPGMVLGIIRLRILNSPLKSLLRVYDKFNIFKKWGYR